MARTVAIGKQDFSKVIEGDYFYIDKTLFIKEWWESGDDVTLITRPRRFGKTLTMSMVEQFFSVKYAGRKELFENLNIWKEEIYKELQGTYPVISLSFAGIKEKSYQETKLKICQIITNIYAEYAFLLDSSHLTESDRSLLKKISPDMDDVTAAMALHQLSIALGRHYGKGVIILLDEYDTPMQEAYVNGYWDELAGFMRNIFNVTFKTNRFLERAIMTGITRVGKESIFSDLNNLEVVTTTSPKYEKIFGFTEDEVCLALDEYGLQEKRAEVKEWFDGFRFGNCDDIYNPWSIIQFLNKREFAAYWINTSSNALAEKLIREGGAQLKLIIEDLLNGIDYRAQIDEEIIYNQLDYDESAVWSLLLASGYLKVKQYLIDSEWGDREYVLALTNKEVIVMIRGMIRKWFALCKTNYNIFLQALLSGDKKIMNDYMNRVALTTFSTFDSGTKPSENTEPERFYHGFVLGLIVNLEKQYLITSNRESGLGRYDVLLEPTVPSYDGIVLEFKVQETETETSLKDTAASAIKQIIEKKYAAVLEAKGLQKDSIRVYGFAFRGKEVFIDGGYIQEYEEII